ncbi:phosphatidylinositol kinase (plasmid) [Aminobacter sp. Y103A]|uniref:HipA domain-containing protein n=1 Tax=Aminobacter sp. Y103A TaxID=1870862 RepID=UPI0025738D45|nr:HipA domain-containing protein [Aminobacter sp. SS-2016]BBD41083.1 phosphatidylinositol kinase [Aminobacter sp. SS-2016]
MTILLVGETIDRRRAHVQATAGELIQLVRGVYVQANVDVDAAVLTHAVRIAQYLYPTAYLSSASALLLGPTPDGRLFLSGRRNQRTRIRTLEIVQNEAPAHPSTALAIVGDDQGEIRIEVSSPRQRFLEAFRLRSEHASAITDELRADMAARLIEEFGSPQAVADAVWALARENGWYREGEGAERYLTMRPALGKATANKAALERILAWHGAPLGRLTHDGFEWRWKATANTAPPLVRQTAPGKLPAFVESLLPEGWLAQVLHERDNRDAIRRGKRFMSNVAVVADKKELEALPLDVLQAPLAKYAKGGEFTGRYVGPSRGELEHSFEENLAQLFERAETPRLSGVQIKAPMCLTSDGALIPAIDAPFTHILKPAGTAGFEALPVIEWICLELGRAAGFIVPDAALVGMPDGMAPALVVERFDIRRDAADQRRLALEDFCSVLDLPASAKYDGTIERVARGLRPLSTDPAADLDTLFRRAVFAWLIADGDMHLKNLALLKIVPPGARQFESVRFAPLYDAVTTRVFPGLASDRMALKLSGKDERLTPRDFLTLARTIELPIAHAEETMANVAAATRKAADALSLPKIARDREGAKSAEERVKVIAAERCGAFA